MPNVTTKPIFTQRRPAVVSGGNEAILALGEIHDTGSSTAPVAPVTPNTPVTPTAPTGRAVTRFQFRQLFTLAERIAIDNASVNTALPAQARAAIVTLLTDVNVSAEVNLDLPQVVQGMQFLVSVGLLTADRAAQVLANQPAPV